MIAPKTVVASYNLMEWQVTILVLFCNMTKEEDEETLCNSDQVTLHDADQVTLCAPDQEGHPTASSTTHTSPSTNTSMNSNMHTGATSTTMTTMRRDGSNGNQQASVNLHSKDRKSKATQLKVHTVGKAKRIVESTIDSVRNLTDPRFSSNQYFTQDDARNSY